IYDGSWFQLPRVEDPVRSIGETDFVYISHIHPDHYDPAFLRRYFEKHGEKLVLIADHQPNHLARKLAGDGFRFEIVDEFGHYEIGNTLLSIMPHKTGSASDIDSALIVETTREGRRHCIVNANDIVFDDSTRRELKRRAGEVDILLCGYTGAGPFPQTYFDLDDPDLIVAADQKKKSFFDRYKALVEVIDAKINIPFAGKYLLGGKLVGLNDCRGVADPIEVLDFDDRAVVLADDGGYIDTGELEPVGVRTVPYREPDKKKRLQEIAAYSMDYERLFNLEESGQLPVRRLLALAARRAVARSEVEGDYFYCFRLTGEILVVNANRHGDGSITTFANNETLPSPRSEIRIDIRYLFGLLTHVYHWNNAEVGSQFTVRRFPNQLNRAAQRFLNFLAV
ncbi:MAG: hypothetical protein DWQ08_04490, partial [Proteobacteria bacterium]